MAKKELLISSIPKEKKPATDSLKLTNETIAKFKGKKFDPTDTNNSDKVKMILPLIENYVRPEMAKYKEKSDSLYDYNKAKDPNYPGATAKELNKVTEGKGEHMVGLADTYANYRGITDLKEKLKATPLPTKFHSAGTRSENSDESTEKLYVPDRELTKKFAATKAKKMSEAAEEKGEPKMSPKKEAIEESMEKKITMKSPKYK